VRQFDDPIFAGLLEAAPDATLCVDSDGLIVLVNAQAERLFGYPREELAGQPVEILVPDAIKAGHPDLRAGYAADPRPRQMGAGLDLSGRRRDGTTFPAEISLSAIDTDQGILVSAAIRDVTQQRQADARFRGLLEAAPDATLCVDSDGLIVLVNAQAERLFGYPREELAGQPVEILVPDAIKAGHPDLRAGYAADPRPRQMGAGLDLSGRRRDGTTFPAEISLSAIDTDQGILVSAAIRDVTQQRQARDDLTRTNQNLQSFSYSLAHDLRTPLRGISGFAEALAEDYGDRLDETGREYAGRVQAGCVRMATLIDDLLHLSQVARAEMNLQDVDLSAEVTAICDQLRARDLGRQVRVTVQEGVRVTADRTLIRSALDNLLENAWKFTARRDGAAIEFATAPVGDAPICCYVRDNGAGFDPAYTGKLFQPFQRLHDDGEFPGTGIGLASVRRIIERHGGRTWAEGAVGGGATIYFTFNTEGPMNDKQIMLIEDSP
jgi:PAS domain S-box-containing protein